MGLTLQLTRNVLNTFVGQKAQVLHDLHESVPYLYDNTVGDGPYNAWIDPILADEWQMMGWNNVSEMTKLGMPGVFTHGTFDTWSPSYLMFIAAMHNGISRLYETFGNGGADTEVRTLRPNEYARTWFKQNPPLPRAKWSQRNNNNYEQTGVLTALSLFRRQQQAVPAQLLSEGQAFDREAEDRRAGGVRVSGGRSAARRAGRPAADAAGPGLRDFAGLGAVHGDDARRRKRRAAAAGDAAEARLKPTLRRRMRVRPNRRKSPSPSREPSRRGATCCAWTSLTAASPTRCSTTSTGRPTIRRRASTTTRAGPLANSSHVQVSRVTDVQVLEAKMTRVEGAVRAPGRRGKHGQHLPDNHNADNALITLRYRFPAATFDGGRGAVRSGRTEVQPRLFHREERRGRRTGQGGSRTGRQGVCRGTARRR